MTYDDLCQMLEVNYNAFGFAPHGYTLRTTPSDLATLAADIDQGRGFFPNSLPPFIEIENEFGRVGIDGRYPATKLLRNGK